MKILKMQKKKKKKKKKSKINEKFLISEIYAFELLASVSLVNKYLTKNSNISHMTKRDFFRAIFISE